MSGASHTRACPSLLPGFEQAAALELGMACASALLHEQNSIRANADFICELNLSSLRINLTSAKYYEIQKTLPNWLTSLT